MGKEITSYIKIQVKGGEAAQGSLTAIFGSKGLGGQIKNFCDDRLIYFIKKYYYK